MNLYLLEYNNYYNRIVKREDNIDAYAEKSKFGAILGIKNFNYSDGVSTKQTAFISDEVVQQYGFPDYAIAVDDYDNIIARYWIIDSLYQCKGQYVITLYRDLVADYYDSILSAPMFIEKGPLSDADPFIFNTENVQLNQIKTKEFTLQDRSVTPWIVGYMGTGNSVADDGTTPAPYKFTFERKIQPNYTITTKDLYSSVSGVSEGNNEYLTDYAYQVQAKISSPVLPVRKITFSFSAIQDQPVNWPDGTEIGFYADAIDTSSPISLNDVTNSAINKILQSFKANIGSDLENKTLISTDRNYTTQEVYQKAVNENGKVVYVSEEGKYYQVKVNRYIIWGKVDLIMGTELYTHLLSVCQTVEEETGYITVPSTVGNTTFDVCVKGRNANVELIPYDGVPIDAQDVEIPISRNQLSDAPYCMFAIPFYQGYYCVRDGVVKYGSAGPEIVMDFVNSMSKALSGVGQLVDIQLLPYCPLQDRIVGEAYIDISGFNENADYQFIETDPTYSLGVMVYWCKKSSFSFNIDTTISNPYEHIEFAGTVFQEGTPWPTKVWNETCKYRLCSPNFSSVFEFSPAKNRGVQGFNIDCTYKPFSPYIHVNPLFDGLYGKDFDDPRGLICGGDFSLAQLNDAWETYERQNINYEKTFQRQIENMDYNRKYERVGEVVGAITNNLMGSVQGMNAGALAGPWGAAIGATVGGVTTLAGGIADLTISSKLYDEAKDYTQDLYSFNLQNIQALPTTIGKVSAFTANNKIYPIVEEYTCTNMERQAFIDKLLYNSLTVNRIGTIGEFITYKNTNASIDGRNYFKGKLIRLELENKAEDFHIINTISAELNKGVYI